MTQNNLNPQNLKKITHFWNWFTNNEEAIKDALLLGINYDQVFYHFDRNFNYISKRIGYYIIESNAENQHYKIIFTAWGYKKLFPKIIALEENVPKLNHFKAEAFIKPHNVGKLPNNRLNQVMTLQNSCFTVEELQMELADYNVDTKQLKIIIFLPQLNLIKEIENLENEIEFIVMQILGEIAYRKHLKRFSLKQTPPSNLGLLNLSELPAYIEYLYKINSRGKTSRF